MRGSVAWKRGMRLEQRHAQGFPPALAEYWYKPKPWPIPYAETMHVVSGVSGLLTAHDSAYLPKVLEGGPTHLVHKRRVHLRQAGVALCVSRRAPVQDDLASPSAAGCRVRPSCDEGGTGH